MVSFIIRLFSLLAICLMPLDASSDVSNQGEAIKSTQKPLQKAAESLAEKAAEKVVQKATEEETAKAQIKATRPELEQGPTRVYFRVLVLDIEQIDAANQNFSVNVFLNLTWKDQRLASLRSPERQIPLDEVWNPQVLIANRQGVLSHSLPEVVQVQPDGTVVYRQRYTGKLSQPLNLSDFPLDKHVFIIQFASAAYQAHELDFVPARAQHDSTLVGGAIARQLSLTDWRLFDHKVLATAYQPIDEIQVAGFAFQFEAERYFTYYLWQVVLPLTVVVVMSWAGYWVQRNQVGVRIGVATSSILTLIAHRFVLASLLPRLPYMTRLDYFTVGSTLLVFMALLGVVSTAYLASINRDLMAKKLDMWARWMLPGAFVLLLLWFMRG